MSSEASVRPMEEEDLDIIVELIGKELYGGTDVDPEDLRMLISSTREPMQMAFVLINPDDGRHLGVAIWKIDDLLSKGSIEMNLAWLVLRPELRGNGAGRFLVQETLRKICQHEFFKRHSISRITIEADTEEAVQFHKKVFHPFHETCVEGRTYLQGRPESVLAEGV